VLSRYRTPRALVHFGNSVTFLPGVELARRHEPDTSAGGLPISALIRICFSFALILQNLGPGRDARRLTADRRDVWLSTKRCGDAGSIHVCCGSSRGLRANA
jgi:hypothetical protein